MLLCHNYDMEKGDLVNQLIIYKAPEGYVACEIYRKFGIILQIEGELAQIYWPGGDVGYSMIEDLEISR
jgi:hypothetical protein|tara:strand:+ start:249 stop:455 length:207 start_codon:yes stop_codon:yes gene_type:complete